MSTFESPRSNGISIYYELHGQGAETLLLLNGVMMSTRSWAAHLSELTKHYRVLLHDFRGQGASSQPDEAYSYDLHVDDLKSLLDHLQIGKAHFVGTSYGSEVGMLFAIRYPEIVRSLTVAAGVTYSDELLRAKIRAWILAAEHAIRYGEKRDFYRITIPFNFSADYLRERAAQFEMQAEGVASLPNSWFIAFKRLCESFLELDITSSLDRIQAPTLVIAGTQDELKPLRYSSTIAARIPRARLESIDAGHALVIEKQKEFISLVLDFVR